jgi:two-component system, OmpR family, sensor histidine kinase BaeS
MTKSFFLIDMPAPPVTGVWSVIGGAAVIAILGAALLFDAAPGINWVICAFAACLWGFAVAAPERRPAVMTVLALAVVVAGGAAVTADGMFQFFIAVVTIGLLAVALRLLRVEESEIGAAEIASAPVVELCRTAPQAARTFAEAARGVGNAGSVPVVRGLALALPVVFVFAWLLSGADPLLAQAATAIGQAFDSWSLLPRLVFGLVMGVMLVGAFALGAYPPAAYPPAAATSVARGGRLIGRTERTVVMSGVVLLFAAFLALQLISALGVTPPGAGTMSYAEYAHRGFIELTVVATLCVLLVVTLYRKAAGETERVGWLPFLVIDEVGLLVTLAYHRIVVYENAFGYTALRLYVRVYTVCVAVGLILLACELRAGLDERRVARRAALVAVAALIALSYGNPEGWVVGRNMARYAATKTVDLDYLTTLSPNAMPEIVRQSAALTPFCRTLLLGNIWIRQRPERAHWFEWNLRRVEGRAAIQSAGIAPWATSAEYLPSPATCWN